MVTAPTENEISHWTTRLEGLARDAGVPGATLGVLAGEREFAVAHGVVNAATGLTTTEDTLFQIGSITKVWTTTMIMQLVEEGQLSLDTAVADLLPGVRMGRPDSAADIEVWHLLTHTSGLDGDVFTDTGRGDDSVETYVDGLADVPRAHPVGAAYSYCNAGFVVLGRIIEQLDGRSWDRSLRVRLVEPLGLTDTVTLPEEAILRRTAVGHRVRPRQDEPVSTWQLPRSLGPAGLITATVHDVLRFARLHLDGGVAPDGTRLLSEASVKAMQQPLFAIPSMSGTESIGLGWRLNTWSGRPIFGHDGGTIGQLAYLRIDPRERVAVCLLTNSPESDSVYETLFAEVFASYAAVEMPPGPQPAAPEVQPEGDRLARHVGRYERTSRRYDVSAQGDRLQLVSTMLGDRALIGDEGPQTLELHPVDGTGDNFVCRAHPQEPWTAVSFARSADGSAYVHTGGRMTPRVNPRD
ncbi:MAG: serine hydrolase domain-containing protein [Nocardioidaceae bacterium]